MFAKTLWRVFRHILRTRGAEPPREPSQNVKMSSRLFVINFFCSLYIYESVLHILYYVLEVNLREGKITGNGSDRETGAKKQKQVSGTNRGRGRNRQE